MRQINLLAVIALCSGTVFGAQVQVLLSDLETNGATGKAVYSAYTYDSDGNRINKRSWDGKDSSSAFASRTRYVYNDDKRLSRELLLDTNNDTISITAYRYGTDGLNGISILRKDGSLRFMDTLIYRDGRVVEQRRYNGSAAMTFFHRYGYTDGHQTADTLFEPSGATDFVASQQRIITYNSDGTVAREASLRNTNNQWYYITTTIMAYTAARLKSATTYETEGVTGRLVDSLACSYDENGNRSKESFFDDERTLIRDVVYTWGYPSVPDAVINVAGTMPKNGYARFYGGSFRFSSPFTGTLHLYSCAGRKIVSRNLQNSTGTALATDFSKGRYIAQLVGIEGTSFTCIINN